MSAAKGKKRRAPTRRSRRAVRAVFAALNRNDLTAAEPARRSPT